MNDPSQARQATDSAQQKLHESKDRAVDAATDAADKVRDVAAEKYAEARDTVESKAYEARDAAHERAESEKSNAASGLKDTAHRLRDVSNDLDEKDRWLGATLEQAANVTERAGDYLSGNSLNDLVGDAQQLARRNPAAFMGGAAALGFALARLGKVTADRADLGGSNRQSAYAGGSGVHRSTTHASTDPARMTGSPATPGLGTTHAPTPAGMNTGTTAPGSAQSVTRPTDGRDINPAQSTPMHRSQA